ncbi:MAG: hypothetical protein ACPKOI_01780 [Pleomorphochaeta sp.]
MNNITKRKLFLLWVPLAIMWIVMATEQPMITSFITRMPDATNQLAAFGYSFALALFIEGPVVQMLSAGTAIVKSISSYKKILRVMNFLSVITVTLHLILCIPFVFDFIAINLFNLPVNLLDSAYWCFVLLIPWAPTIGYRRLWQGVMIAHSRSKYVPIVMYVRIAIAFIILFIGTKLFNISGALLGGFTLSLGVISGMITAYVLAKPALDKLPETDNENLNFKQMVHFYIPLAITSWITLGVRPLLNLGITKGAFPVESLAIWPVILAYLFLYTSISQSLQEIIIAEYKKDNIKNLKGFVNIVAISLTVLFFVIYLNKSLLNIWFINVSRVPQNLLHYLPISLLLMSLIPFIGAKIAFYRATLVSIRDTSSITVGVFINVLTLLLSILILPLIFDVAGVYIASIAYALSFFMEVMYLLFRINYLNKTKSIF